MRMQLIAVNRRNGRLEPVHSESVRFKSVRDFSRSDFSKLSGLDELLLMFARWDPEVEAEILPLGIVGPFGGEVMKKTRYYSSLPSDLRKIFDKKCMLKTVVGWTSRRDFEERDKLSKFKALVYAKLGGEGRVGVLLDEKENPVKISLNGREYIVEIKGVGYHSHSRGGFRSDAFDGSTSNMGSMSLEEGRQEFKNSRSEVEEGGPLGLALLEYGYSSDSILSNDKSGPEDAYFLRLSPTTVRASHTGNPGLPNHDPKLVARGFAESFANHLKKDNIHTAPHPENLVWTGEKYVLSDYADLFKINQFTPRELRNYLSGALGHINQFAGLTERHKQTFYRVLCTNLGVVVPKLKLNQQTVAKAVWNQFLSKRLSKLNRKRRRNR